MFYKVAEPARHERAQKRHFSEWRRAPTSITYTRKCQIRKGMLGVETLHTIVTWENQKHRLLGKRLVRSGIIPTAILYRTIDAQ